VRVFHWSLVAGFIIAYFTEGDLLKVHVWAGYAVGLLIVARLLWGFIGGGHARFSDFIYDPVTTLHYLRDLVRFRGTPLSRPQPRRRRHGRAAPDLRGGDGGDRTCGLWRRSASRTACRHVQQGDRRSDGRSA
jgi:Prokaryotic cytochrome b561